MLTKQLLDLATVGGEWVLWALIALSVLSVGVVVERWWWFFQRRCDLDALVPQLLQRLRARDAEGAKHLLAAHPSEEARIVEQCLEWEHAGGTAMNHVLEATIRQRRKTLEHGLTFLGTVGNNAPFIGLFGTVLGVVEAFVQLGHQDVGSMDAVMGGIGEALVATAAGILVAIPAVVAYNVFSRKALHVEDNAETLVGMILAVGEEHAQTEGTD